MNRYMYWHAPLWEVLAVVFISLIFLGWLVGRALRRPTLSAALSAINPALSEPSFFFFDPVKGLMCLNDAAEQTLNTLPTSQRQFLLEALMETLLEAYAEARVTQHDGWPESNATLVAVPISSPLAEVTGVLALVTIELPPLPAERPVDAPLAIEPEAWLTVGSALRVHGARPVAQVRRGAPHAEATWQEYELSLAEETLLRYLLEHQAEVQPAATLFRAVWPDDELDEYGLRPEQKDRLRQLVYQLRQHVEADPHHPRYVCTAHGIGYVLYLEQGPPIP
ncbi:MAG TPA: helix-turn-helix domain-containing protein [Anaerolineae bacterium]|nr:helix-turn-helix domain-containing protein [Anaerolineae bacterium]HXK42943.1 helix-turn-helix domain-containing protein [Anaerolineae bacterium]